VGRAAGITEAQLAALPRWEASDAFDPLERRVLEYAGEMTKTPVEVPPALFEALRAELGPAGLVELSAAIAWENYRARFNHAFGVESEGYSEGAVCLLPG